MKTSTIVYTSNTGFTAQYATLMAIMKAILSKETDAQSRKALKAIELGADWVSAQQLEPVLDWLRE